MGEVSDPRLEVAARRLVNQRLAGATLDGPAEVVRWLGAVQAQEYPVARWSIGQRAHGLSEAAVDDALAAGQILRTHVLRDTWHLVTAEDIRWMVELTGPRIQARNATMYRRLGLDARLLARTDALLLDALTASGQLTRRQLGSFLLANGVQANGPRLGYILMHAELELLICSGAMEGKQQTYALLDKRAAEPTLSMPRDKALAVLAKRYFGSRGPATVKDFSWWASLRVGDARQGIELLGDELEPAEIEGRTYWSVSGSSPAKPMLRSAAPTAHLLQAYDEYIIAYSESRDVLDVQRLAALEPGGRAIYTHGVVLDGQVIGHWRRSLTRSAMTIDLQLARPITPAERTALDAAVERYGRFVGLPASWSTLRPVPR